MPARIGISDRSSRSGRLLRDVIATTAAVLGGSLPRAFSGALGGARRRRTGLRESEHGRLLIDEATSENPSAGFEVVGAPLPPVVAGPSEPTRRGSPEAAFSKI